MMATTELEKIPETILSRSQVYEFRTIGTRMIAGQLRRIVDAEGISVGDDSLQLIARDADGSMRDAQSKLDQVIAFTGKTIGPDDVSTVLGLVGRDLLLDTVQAVADEEASGAFVQAGRAVEMGYDLRLVCRELARVVRDLLILNVDPSRAGDPEIAGESERDRLIGLAARFSREDLLRAFDLLTKAESDIKSATQPRYHLEMALLRWIYLRKLVPIEQLMQSAGSQGPTDVSAPRTASPSRPASTVSTPSTPSPRSMPRSTSSTLSTPSTPSTSSTPSTLSPRDALLAEIKKSKVVFYNTVVAQAQKIEVSGDRVTFTFAPAQRTIRDMFEQNRSWLESVAQQVQGRKMLVGSVQAEPIAEKPAAPGDRPLQNSEKQAGQSAPVTDSKPVAEDRKSALRAQALADSGVQALLEVFPAEIRDIEEM
jgi:DNA polymerase III gamma/tau subunit